MDQITLRSLIASIDREMMLQEWIRYLIFCAIFSTACVYIGTAMKLNDIYIEIMMLASCALAMHMVFGK